MMNKTVTADTLMLRSIGVARLEADILLAA